MLVLAIKWLLPLAALGFLAGAMCRGRYQVLAALAVAAACAYYFFNYKQAEVPAMSLVLSIALCIGGYGGGNLFGRFVQSEVKGRPLMTTLSLLTVACLLFTTGNSSI